MKVLRVSVVNSPSKLFLFSSKFLKRTTEVVASNLDLSSALKVWAKTASSKVLVTLLKVSKSADPDSPKKTTTTSLSAFNFSTSSTVFTSEVDG
jgi:hypothetical protein